MNRTRLWRLVLLSGGDAPPPLPALLAQAEDAEWNPRTLDAFLAELDAGGALPDAVLAFGGTALIRALRRHDRTCALPVFLFGAPGTLVPPGWDGAWTGEDCMRIAERVRQGAWTAGLPLPTSALDSMRNEQRFARWFAARGEAAPSDAEAFGVDAPRSLLQAWRERGFIAPEDAGGARWRALPALRQAAGDASVAAAAPLHPASAEVPAPATGLPTASEHAGGRARSFTLIAAVALLIALGALAWRTGGIFPRARFAPEQAAASSLRIGVPRAHADPPPSPAAPAVPAAQDRQILAAPTPADPEKPALDLPAVAVPAALAKAPPAPAPPPERVVARGLLRREESNWRATAAGRIAGWIAAPGDHLVTGAPILRLEDPEAAAEIRRLEQEIARLDEAVRAQETDAADAEQRSVQEADAERARLEQAASRASGRARDARARYQRSLSLAQQGVLAYRDVRPDWEALQRAQEDEEEALRRLEDFAPPRGAARGELPAWLAARRLQLQEDLQTQRDRSAVRVLRAPQEADLLACLVSPGDRVEEGDALARFGLGEAWFEVRLDAGDRHEQAAVREPELRLRPDAPWTPVAEFEQALLPGGAALLRVKVPAGLRDAARSGAEAEVRFLMLPGQTG